MYWEGVFHYYANWKFAKAQFAYQIEFCTCWFSAGGKLGRVEGGRSAGDNHAVVCPGSLRAKIRKKVQYFRSHEVVIDLQLKNCYKKIDYLKGKILLKKKISKDVYFYLSRYIYIFFPLFLYFLTWCVAASCDINPFSMIKSFLYNIMSVRTVLLFFGIGLNRNQKNWQFSCQIGSYPNWKLYLGFTATHGSIFGEKNMKIWQLLWWKLDRRIKYVLSKNTFVQFWF